MQPEIAQAFEKFNSGDVKGAEAICKAIVAAEPDHPGALHLLGVACLMRAEWVKAADFIAHALRSNPDDPAMLENLGVAQMQSGDAPAALISLRRAVDGGGDNAALRMRLGIAYAAAGRLGEAEAELRGVVAQKPPVAEPYMALANVLVARGNGKEAIPLLQTALQIAPDHVDAAFNLATVYKDLGRYDEAAAGYQDIIARHPDHADALNNFGIVREAQSRIDAALQFYQRAVDVAPDHVPALNNLGNVLMQMDYLKEARVVLVRARAAGGPRADTELNLGNVYLRHGDPDVARGHYERAIELAPQDPENHRALGLLHVQSGDQSAAMRCFEAALAIDPWHAQALTSCGDLERQNHRADAANRYYRKALERHPDYADAHYGLAEALQMQGLLDEAVQHYRAAVALRPSYAGALATLIHTRQTMCDWDGIDILWKEIKERLGRMPPAVMSPFSLLSMPTTPVEQRRSAKVWSRHHYAPFAQFRRPPFRERAAGDLLRVGYLSTDFRRHAVSYLMAEAFELHDRKRFEVLLYDIGADDASPVRNRLKSAATRFVEMGQLTPREAAGRIRDDGVDILVDINAYTYGARTEILARRPAPVQVNWLGYPGTMGASFIDYIIADPTIIPEGAEEYYTERVWRLPDCYQPNDRLREIAATPTRASCGLPDDAFVFCCFNQTYKILPDVFASWMRLLKAVHGSVLWLVSPNRWAGENLRAAAAAHGVAPERLVFARRLPMPDYMAQYRLADLALDTFPYTSHTTGSDALRMGCPFVTHPGTSFASRVAASLLHNVGLDELIAKDAAGCEALTLALARDPARLEGVRARLKDVVTGAPLYDTARFVRNLEAAYEGMYETVQSSAAGA